MKSDASKTSTRVRHAGPHTSSKASVTGSSTECTEAKKIASESCRQVSVAAAESAKKYSPDVPSVQHETQEELQKPRAIPLKLPANWASRASSSRRQPNL